MEEVVDNKKGKIRQYCLVARSLEWRGKGDNLLFIYLFHLFLRLKEEYVTARSRIQELEDQLAVEVHKR